MATTPTAKPTAKPKLKYRLREHYDRAIQLPALHNLNMQQVGKLLHDEFGIAFGTFRNDMMLEATDKKCIREDRLYYYAQFFGVSVEELRNYKVTKGRSLEEIVRNAEYQNSAGPLFHRSSPSQSASAA